MPRRGRPAQGHAPAEGVAQYDMAHLFVADAERRTQALGATRMVVEWLVNRRSQSGLTDLLGARAPLGFGKHRSTASAASLIELKRLTTAYREYSLDGCAPRLLVERVEAHFVVAL